jgi:DNA-directed RNA polymerase subunit M/transcription elongation factor TFIIS
MNEFKADIEGDPLIFHLVEFDHKCPKCGSRDVSFSRESYEDNKHEMIEDFMFCNNCAYDERYA